MKNLIFLSLFLISSAFGEFSGGGGVNCGSGTSGQVYTTNGTTCSFTTVAGSGTVIGPVSSTDRAITTWNGTSGINLFNNSSATIDGSGNLTANNLISSGLTANTALTANGSKQLASSATTATELGYVSGVTSAIQTQMDTKAPLASPTFTGTATFVTGVFSGAITTNVTASKAVFTDSSSKLTSNNLTGTGNVVMSASPTLTGTAVFASGTFSGVIKAGNCHLEPAETDIGNTGSAQSIDLSTGNVWTGTLNASSTFTFSNPVAGCPYVFVLTQGSGGQTLTTAGVTVIWGNTGAKTLSTASGAIDKISCVYNGALTKLMCDLSTTYQ